LKDYNDKLEAAKARVDAAEKAAAGNWFGASADQTAEVDAAKKSLAALENEGPPRIEKTEQNAKEDSSRRIQGMFKMWAARKMCALKKGGSCERVFHQAVLLAKGKHDANVRAFQEALEEQAEQGVKKDGLQEPAFQKALQKVHPKLSTAQVGATWQGIKEQTDREDVDVKIFCQLCHAVSLGMDRASEFADMATEDFIALGNDSGNLEATS